MKAFTTAAAQNVAERNAEREEKIKTVLAENEGMTRTDAEKQVDEAGEEFVEFEFDGRKMKAFQPTSGQLTFIMAAMGRGQTKQTRFGAVMNIMMESLDEDSQDYIESRLLSRKPNERLEVEELEPLFEHLVEEWFADPSQKSSDSAP